MMPLSKNQDITDLFEELFLSVKEMGIEKVSSLLHEKRLTHGLSTNDESIILQIVSSELGIPIQGILFGRSNDYWRKVSIGILVNIFQHFFDYSLSQVAKSLNKHVSLCSKHKMFILRIKNNTRIEEEKKVLISYNNIIEKVKDHVERM